MMKPLPIDAVSAAEFIVRRLYRPLSFGQTDCLAAVETEHPFAGDNWFWTDDNAKIIEFLSRPELRERYRTETEQIYRFLRIMCRGPLILRRVSTPRLLLTERQGNETSYFHSLMHVRSDLRHGVVIAGIRFHDKRTADNLLLHTNCVEFTYRNRQYTVAVEPAIDRSDSNLDGNRLELRYSAELRFKPRRQELPVGRISYTYTFDACSMAIGVEAVLDVDSSAEISDVVMTVGHDHLSHGTNNVHYSSVFAAQPGREPLRFTVDTVGRQTLPAGGAEYYSIVQKEMAGFALAVHSAPREPHRLVEIETLARNPTYLHFARARYRFGGSCRGNRLVIGEDKMLTAGGFYERIDDYRQLLRDAIAARSSHETSVDFSVSYDYGAELHAFANYFASFAAGNGAGDGREQAKLLFDTYLDHYFALFVAAHQRRENLIFSRQLAFVILAILTMYRATGSAGYRARLVQLCEVMLEFEQTFDDVAGLPVSGFTMGAHNHRIVYVDCHSAALLALTEAMHDIDDPRLAAAIDRGLGCYSIETARIDWHDGAHKIDTIGVQWIDEQGVRQSNHGFWTYHAGLTLRFFAALRRSADPRLREIAARHRERIELLEMIIRWHIEHSLSRHDGAAEIRCSVLSTETNSETQPWTTVGLLEQGWA